MTAQTPNPFPTDGQRKLSTQELYERMQAHACMATAPSAKPSCEGQVFVGLRKPARFLAPLTLACAWLLSACQPQDSTIAVPYGAVNHTDIGIASIVINGQGGILAPPKHGQAGGVCCVVVPRQWHPGLTVTIEWRENGTLKKDDQGREVLDDGVPVLIEAPWKSRTVPIPRYGQGEVGDFYVFFFPGDDVRAALTSSPEWKAWWAPTDDDLKFGNRIKKP